MSTIGGHRLVPIRPSPHRSNEGKSAPYVPSSSQSPSTFSPPNSALKRKFSDDESDDSDAESCKRRINFAVNYVVSPQPVSISRRNARERNRVKQVNNGFAALRQHIPSAAKAKKISKVDTLKQAVEYIQNLQQLLAENDEALEKERQFLNGLHPQHPVHQRELLPNRDVQGQSTTSFIPDAMNFLFQPCSPDEKTISPSSSFSGQISSPDTLNSSQSPREHESKFNFSNLERLEKRNASASQFPSLKSTYAMSPPLTQSNPPTQNHVRMKTQNENIYQQSHFNSKQQVHCTPGGGVPSGAYKSCHENSPGDLYDEAFYFNQENSPEKMSELRAVNSAKVAYASIRENVLEQRPQCDQENSPKEIYLRPQPQAGVHVHSYNRNGPQALLPVTSDPFRVLGSNFKGPNILHHFNATNNQSIGQIVGKMGNKNLKAPVAAEENKFPGLQVNTCVVKPMNFIAGKPFGSSSGVGIVKPISTSETKTFDNTLNSDTISETNPVCENKMFVPKSMTGNEKLFVNSTHSNIKPVVTNESKFFGRAVNSTRGLMTNENQVVGIPQKYYATESNCEALSGDLPPNHLTNIDCDIASNFPSFENLEDVYKVIDPTSPLGVEGDLLDAIDLWEKC